MTATEESRMYEGISERNRSCLSALKRASLRVAHLSIHVSQYSGHGNGSQITYPATYQLSPKNSKMRLASIPEL